MAVGHSRSVVGNIKIYRCEQRQDKDRSYSDPDEDVSRSGSLPFLVREIDQRWEKDRGTIVREDHQQKSKNR